ncbi:hypothetical protein BP6252_13770 [Coleophoma cylindrospora]|uniref:Heterokaryon incompatibility domain-containing protein n=1 Tax=Coleophoma cylindrospora TaxID=1849047 RepID=A0A3D8Q768_9HELO|nr:hypothetical protein BP6252_13770 [Coleophoma cylindrospora]
MGKKRDSLKALFKLPSRSPRVYQYTALSLDGAIRLLELKPAASRQQAIHCSLSETKLSPEIQYEALSYVWGSDELSETLRLPGGHLKITPSLASALKGLRLDNKPRTLWVDAVCINQSDDLEKGSQVAKMAAIYRNASGVLAWLGEDVEHAVVDMQAIASLAQKANGLGLGDSLIGQRDILMAWFRRDTTAFTQTMDFMTVAEQANFSLLYGSDWFTRMWIVQEVLLASRLTLFRGPKSISWKDFERVMICLHTIREAIHLSVPDVDSFVKNAWNLIVVRNHYDSFPEREGDPRLDFDYYVNQLRRRDCKDDRDRVYALRSLLPENSDLTITPDYKKSTVEVFTDLARQQLQHGHMEIFFQAGLCRNLADTFQEIMPYNFPPSEPVPSWVPDYRKDITYIGWMPYFGDDSSFLPDPTIAPSCALSVDNPRGISINGTFLDPVEAAFAFPFVHDGNLRADHPKIFFMIRTGLRWLYEKCMAHYSSRSYPNGEDPTSAFAYALLGGGTSEQYKEAFRSGVKDEVQTPLEVWQAYQEQCLSEEGELYQEMMREVEYTGPARRVNGIRQEWYENSTHSGKAWELTHYLKVLFRYHVFFTTNQGYIGLAPLGTKRSTDAIVFIDGLKVPFVLRNVAEAKWKVVGPCYMHGMVDAEAARTNERFGARLTFPLI